MMQVVVEASVWGFINVGNPNFEVGDVLKSAGWKTPALNKARGNILKGYDVRHNKMRIYNRLLDMKYLLIKIFVGIMLIDEFIILALIAFGIL